MVALLSGLEPLSAHRRIRYPCVGARFLRWRCHSKLFAIARNLRQCLTLHFVTSRSLAADARRPWVELKEIDQLPKIGPAERKKEVHN